MKISSFQSWPASSLTQNVISTFSTQRKVIAIGIAVLLCLGVAYILFKKIFFKAKPQDNLQPNPVKSMPIKQEEIIPQKTPQTEVRLDEKVDRVRHQIVEEEEPPAEPILKPQASLPVEEKKPQISEVKTPTPPKVLDERESHPPIDKQISKVESPKAHRQILADKIDQFNFPHLLYNAALVRGDKIGLKIAEYHKEFVRASKQLKYEVRDKTIAQVREWLGDASKSPFDACYDQYIPTSAVIQKYLSMNLPPIKLFRDKEQEFHETSMSQLFGRYDVLATPLKMSYNEFWKENSAPNMLPFFMHSAAAINIGESDKAEDFFDFSLQDPITNLRQLDEKNYLLAMGTLFDNILRAQEHCQITDAVWFPFGMGAFLRNLSLNDQRYQNPQKLYELREKIAATFIEAIKLHPRLNIHLCLPASKPGEESSQNYNAFLAAIKRAKNDVGQQVKIYVNVDASALAQRLAQKGNGAAVSLVNGANRSMLGNHWFGERALTAIDENIHRRSFLGALTALLLNEGTRTFNRRAHDLEMHVRGLKGEVIEH